MSEPGKKVSLSQAATGEEDHAARVMREKIGDVGSLGGVAGQTVITGVDAADQKAILPKIIAALRSVFDPEIPLNIYDLGLIYRIAMDPVNAIKVQMTLTAPGCPVAGSIVAEVKRKLEAIGEIPAVDVELVWDPPWTRDRLTEAARLELGMF